MSPFGVVEWVLGIGPKVVDLGERIARAVRPKPKEPVSTWDRPHFFTVRDYDEQPWVYACQWCKTRRSSRTTLSKCPGPIDWQRNTR